MTTVTITAPMPAPASVVWEVASPDFCGIAGFHPALESCELSAHDEVRRLTLLGGGQIVEKQTAWDDEAHTYSYDITESPLPVDNYSATFSVADDGAGSTVTWTADFDAVGNEAEAREVIADIFRTGLDALKAKL